MRRLIFSILLVLFAAGVAEAQPYSANREIKVKYFNGNDFVYPEVDGNTNTVSAMDYEHHEIHAGDHFFTKNVATVASGTTVAYLMATSGTSKEVHLTWSGTGSAITDVTMIEAVPSTLKGTKQTIFNNNRNVGNVSGCTFYTTVTGGPWTGTTIYRINSGAATQQSRTPATQERRAELILKSGVTYCFVFKSGTNDNLTNLVCEWYEHVPKN